jgi:molybdenum cofactor cytidylyltransferase
LIAAVILASGFSQRMGRSKLTLELEGKTFLQRAVEAAQDAHGVGRLLVVVQPEDEGLVPSGPAVVLNPEAALGQSASIRLAAAALAADPGCEAVIFSVVDQPLLQPEVFDTLAQAWAAGRGEILVSSYAGQRGSPVLFARRFLDELQQISGDIGGREVMRRHPELVAEVEMPDPRVGQDVDTWEEYLQLGGVQSPVAE